MQSESPRDPVPRDGTTESLELLVAHCLERMESRGDDALDECCERNPEVADELRRRVERLQGLGLTGPRPSERPDLPESIGGHRLVRRLGGGGMGEVFLAEQSDLGRLVALKVVRPELLAVPAVRRRFETEIETVARLNHPGVVPIHTVGEAEGVPFFTMEYVRGCTLAEVLDEVRERDPSQLSGADFAQALRRAMGDDVDRDDARADDAFQGTWIDVCLELARKVALTLDYVHLLGVLHKDVKPSNILVTPDGRALLIDFGLAAVEGAARESLIDHAPGSLPYMSPEQIEGDPRDLDARTDLYSLGVTLAQLITLRLPIPSHGTQYDVTRAILEGSRVVLRKRNRLLSRNAETVCLVAMSRERSARYGSASELARDLGNALAHRPIEARRSPPWRTLHLWVRRHPGWAAATLLFLIGVATIVTLERRADRRDEGLRLMYNARSLVEENPGLSLLLGIEAHRRAPSALTRGALYGSLDELRERRTLFGRDVNSPVAVQLGGALVAAALPGGRVAFYKLPEGKLARTLTIGAEPRRLHLEESGRLLLVMLTDGRLQLWDTETSNLAREFRRTPGRSSDPGVAGAPIDALEVVAGTRALALDQNGQLTLWSMRTGEALGSRRLEWVGVRPPVVDLHPDGRRALIAWNGSIALWEPERDPALIESRFDGIPVDCEYAPDGRRFLVASDQARIDVFESVSAKPVRSIRAGGNITMASFILGASRIVASVGGEVVQWDVETGTQLATFRVDQPDDVGFALSGDGRIATTSRDRTVKIWSLESGEELATLRGHTSQPNVFFTGLADCFVTASPDRTLRIWRLESIIPTLPLEAPAGQLPSARISPDDGRVVTFSLSNAWIFDTRTGALMHTLDHGAAVLKATFGPDGALVALAGRDGSVSIWAADTGQRRSILSEHSAQVWYAEFSPDGRSIAPASSDGTCVVFDLASERPTHRFAPGGELGTVAFSPDGRRIVTGNTEFLVHVYDLTARELNADEPTLVLRGHTGLIYRALFSPRGDRIASCSADATVRLWDASTGEQLAVFGENMGDVRSVEFHPNGDYLVTTTAGGTVCVWSLDERAPYAKLERSFGELAYARFSADGTRILTIDNTPTMRSWPFDIYAEALRNKPRELTPEERRAWF